VKPAKESSMQIIRVALSLFLVAWAGFSAAGTPRLGGSLGMAFPTDRLADTTEPMGNKLLPAPGLGLIGAFDPVESLPQLSCEGVLEVNIFRSEDDKNLQVIYVPVQVAGLWKVGSTGGLDMQVRAGAGGGFLSANSGSPKSLSGVAVSFGWRVGKDLKDLSCAVETGFDLLFNTTWGGPQNMFRFKLLLFTR